MVCVDEHRLRAISGNSTAIVWSSLLNIHYRHEGYERVSATNPGGLGDKLADYFAGNLAGGDTETATGAHLSTGSMAGVARYPCGRSALYGPSAAPTGTTGRHAQSVLRC